MSRQAKVTRTLEDGSIEEFYIDLDKPSNKKVKTKSSRKKSNEDNKKQEEKQTTSASKASVEITRAES
tara:strand:- start:1403 stop:1606 length:204 start_codon:yes stop_codon:yes gene_type:complete